MFRYFEKIKLMTNSFYKTLYQHDTLYHVPDLTQNVDKEIVAVISEPKLVIEKPIEEKPQVAQIQKPIEPVPVEIIAPTLNHQVLFLTNELSPSDAIFLEKVLKAVNLNLDGVDILNFEGAQLIDFKPLLRAKKIHHFISFGVPFLKVNLDIMMNRYDIKVLSGINFLFTDPLAVIQEDDQLKRALWGCLKTIFVK